MHFHLHKILFKVGASIAIISTGVDHYCNTFCSRCDSIQLLPIFFLVSNSHLFLTSKMLWTFLSRSGWALVFYVSKHEILGLIRSASLQVSGKVTYNGHEMNEFVPQRTCAYISQRDLQMGELTVRETLDFSGRCQGVGSRYGEQWRRLLHVDIIYFTITKSWSSWDQIVDFSFSHTLVHQGGTS